MGESGSNPKPDEDQPSSLRSPLEDTPAGTPKIVLIVEDNESDVFLIREAIEATKLPLTLQVVKDGSQAVQFVDRIDSDATMHCPALVILDINLPKMQGGEVLRHMRRSRKCARAPVVIVSTSDSGQDREQMANLGANEYFRKPSSYDAFMKLGDVVKGLLSGPREQ